MSSIDNTNLSQTMTTVATTSDVMFSVTRAVATKFANPYCSKPCILLVGANRDAVFELSTSITKLGYEVEPEWWEHTSALNPDVVSSIICGVVCVTTDTATFDKLRAACELPSQPTQKGPVAVIDDTPGKHTITATQFLGVLSTVAESCLATRSLPYCAVRLAGMVAEAFVSRKPRIYFAGSKHAVLINLAQRIEDMGYELAHKCRQRDLAPILDVTPCIKSSDVYVTTDPNKLFKQDKYAALPYFPGTTLPVVVLEQHLTCEEFVWVMDIAVSSVDVFKYKSGDW